MGHPEFLSERAWFRIGIDANQVDREAPAEGVLLDYAFDAQAVGEYEVWARIGYEFVRSPFDWRLDGGPWQSVAPDELTTDLMELSFWTEVAWLKLGKQPLAAGPHTLSFRLPKTKDAARQAAANPIRLGLRVPGRRRVPSVPVLQAG